MTLRVQMLLARPLGHMLEPIVARESESLPTPALLSHTHTHLVERVHGEQHDPRHVQGLDDFSGHRRLPRRAAAAQSCGGGLATSRYASAAARLAGTPPVREISTT